MNEIIKTPPINGESLIKLAVDKKHKPFKYWEITEEDENHL
jgi:hypothetical protein